MKSDNIIETENDTSETTSTLSTTITNSCTFTSVSSTFSIRTVIVTTVKEDILDGELVRILDYIPVAVINLRYATTNNFTEL